MNDLPSNLVSSNQHDLERVEQGNKFPAEPDEVDADKEFKFFVYPFSKMEEKFLTLLQALPLVLFLKLTHNMVELMSLMSMRNQTELTYSSP